MVITGPSGVGKGTLIRRLLTEVPGLVVSTSATTRSPRPGEIDGREYHFLSRSEFDSRVEAGDFLESAEYAGNLYGTLNSELKNRGDAIRAVVLEIETLGAATIRRKVPGAIQMFIAPPSPESLRQRLVGRGTDAPLVIEQRLETATRELARQSEFDTVIINDDLDTAATELAQHVAARLDCSSDKPTGDS